MNLRTKSAVREQRPQNRVSLPLLTKRGVRLHLRHKDVSRELVRWFEEEGRSFPWRSQQDPYAILIAEKLLQQTAARPVVVEAYSELLDRYPTAFDLARANIRTLTRIVRPLGLIYRAAELRALGQHLVSQFGGQVPVNLPDLMSLPGVGEYAARAVLSFALDQDVAVVDTNVARFLHRLFGISAALPANPARSSRLTELASYLIPKGGSKKHNLAILDLCTVICKPTRPECQRCPVSRYCAFLGSNRV